MSETLYGDGPELWVEVAFEEDATLASPTWTDITSYVRELTITRGRQSELEQTQPGVLNARLDNRDRRFDPFNESGPYWPYVEPMKQIRVRARYNAQDYDLFRGYVDSWPQVWPTQTDALIELRATDAFKVFAQYALPENAWHLQMQALRPTAWYRFAEEEGATVALDSSGNEHHGQYENEPTLGLEGVMEEPGDDRSFSCALASDQRMLVRDMSILTQFPVTCSFVVRISTVSEPGPALIRAQQWDSFSGDLFAIGISPGGPLQIGIANAGTAFAGAITTQLVDDAIRHHLVVVADSDGVETTFHLYVDGVEDTNVLFSDPVYFPRFHYAIGVGNIPKVFDEHQPRIGFFGFYDDCAIWNGAALTQDEVQALTFAMRGRYGEKTGARINWLLDCLGWPQDLRDIDTGQTTLQNAGFSGSALDYLLKLAETENGNIYMTTDGKIRFRERHAMLLEDVHTTSQATFSDDGTDLPYHDLQLEPSDVHIRNTVTLQRRNGQPITLVDEDSQKRYMVRAFSRTGLLHNSDTESRNAGEWILGHYARPIQRVRQMIIRPRGDASLWPHVLGLDLEHRITIERTPPGGGDQIVQEAHIERITHRITPENWETRYELSPADSAAYWVLGESKLGETTRLAY